MPRWPRSWRNVSCHRILAVADRAGSCNSEPRRDLREKAFVAWTSRGAGGGETDNRAITAEILNLRHERAALLGYASFADYKLETEMAKTPAALGAQTIRDWVLDASTRGPDGACRCQVTGRCTLEASTPITARLHWR